MFKPKTVLGKRRSAERSGGCFSDIIDNLNRWISTKKKRAHERSSFTKAEFQRKLLLRNYILIKLFSRILLEAAVKANALSSGNCFKNLKIYRMEIDSLNFFIGLHGSSMHEASLGVHETH